MLVTISVKLDSAVLDVAVAVPAAAGMGPEAIWCALGLHPARPSLRRGRRPRSLDLR